MMGIIGAAMILTAIIVVIASFVPPRKDRP